MEQFQYNQAVARKKVWHFFLIAAMILFLYISYTAYSIWSFGQRTELVRADAAVVLGAALHDGEPSPVLKGRIDHALLLYHDGVVDKLIFTGGSGGEGEISEAEAAEGYALAHGVKAGDIIIETTSTITEENLQNAITAVEQSGVTSFLIVSDPLHMKRAMTMAADLDMKAYSSPTRTSAYQSLGTKLPFLLREVFFYIGYQAVSPFRSSPG